MFDELCPEIGRILRKYMPSPKQEGVSPREAAETLQLYGITFSPHWDVKQQANFLGELEAFATIVNIMMKHMKEIECQ